MRTENIGSVNVDDSRLFVDAIEAAYFSEEPNGRLKNNEQFFDVPHNTKLYMELKNQSVPNGLVKVFGPGIDGNVKCMMTEITGAYRFSFVSTLCVKHTGRSGGAVYDFY